jgi:hypothetical protein
VQVSLLMANGSGNRQRRSERPSLGSSSKEERGGASHMKYFYYVSRSKVEMRAPQLRRPKFSFKLSPKVAVAGVSIGADIERRDDSA